MKKIFSLFCVAAVATTLSAKVVFCDPASTIDKGRAQNWEAAVAPSAMATSLGGLTAGDTVCIKGGVVLIHNLGELWQVNKGITIIGGYDNSLSGTDHPMPEYPALTPTVFSGDVNGNGIPDAGDAQALIRVNLENHRDEVFTLQGVDLANTFYLNRTESTEDIDTYASQTAALRIMCGTAYIKNCEIYNHRAPITRGSQSITVVGAHVHFRDCDVHNGVCMSRGGLLRARNYFIDHSLTDPVEPSIVIERCAFYSGNSTGGDSLNIMGNYGGGIHVSTGDFFAINSTFVMDTTYSAGGGIRPNHNGVKLISCTIGQNYSARVDDPKATQKETYGSDLFLDEASPLYIANSFIVNDFDKFSKATAPFYSDKNNADISEFIFSEGYNVLGNMYMVAYGSRVDDQSSVWKTTDKLSTSAAINKFSTYFGEIQYNFARHNGFSKTIFPLSMQNGDNVAHLQDLANQWCPAWTHVNAAADQRGYGRNKDVTCVGAAALDATEPITDGLQELKAAFKNNDQTVYNVLGQPVGADYKGIVIQGGQKYLVK